MTDAKTRYASNPGRRQTARAGAPRSSTATRDTRSPLPSTSPLDKPIQYVRGVGPLRGKRLAEAGILTFGDLIEYFPFRFEEQPAPKRIDELILDEQATIIGAVESVRWRGGMRNPTARVRLNDGTGIAFVTFFNAAYLRDKLEQGSILRLFGKIETHEDHAQLTNPRTEWLSADDDPKQWNVAQCLPVYRAIGDLSSGQIARIIQSALEEALPAIVDPLPADLVKQRRWPGRADAIRIMHLPQPADDRGSARDRLAFEELYLMQLAISLQRRWSSTRARAPKLQLTDEIDRRIRRRFPFELTDAQNRVIRHIARDLGEPRPMTRLLQGDVGSGKTVVALYAALLAVAHQQQVAILAPTAVLAEQHAAGIEQYLASSRVRRCLLTGKTSPVQRQRDLQAIASGDMDLIVGTQALLEENVTFHALGLVIVDEQHKFGVAQRATLRGKSGTAGRDAKRRAVATRVPHYLVMSATPIPRTLTMTVFGDLDVSIIDALPPGRQPIETILVTSNDEQQAWLEIRRRIAQGDQVYVVYPLVEESETMDLKAATTEVSRVRTELLPGARVGLLHGRMHKREKQSVMSAFVEGRLDVLVATTVIEVGVDVPNATVMAIQHAERFGLSALHQLRGRVGRGTKPSICCLFSDSQGETARQRLGILCETTDGFRIAEQDLRIRGPGELLGTRQHGWPEFRLASLTDDTDLLLLARDHAARLADEQPRLDRPEHTPLKQELRRRFRDKVAFIDVG